MQHEPREPLARNLGTLVRGGQRAKRRALTTRSTSARVATNASTSLCSVMTWSSRAARRSSTPSRTLRPSTSRSCPDHDPKKLLRCRSRNPTTPRFMACRCPTRSCRGASAVRGKVAVVGGFRQAPVPPSSLSRFRAASFHTRVLVGTTCLLLVASDVL